MPKKPSKKTPKNITIDQLAGMTQREFLRVDERFSEAQKEHKELRAELKDARDETLLGFKIIRHELREGFADLKVTVKTLSAELDVVRKDHEHRIHRLEKVAGLAK